MAECVMNREGQRRFKAYSAGGHTRGELNRFGLDLLKRRNFDVSGLHSRREFATPDAPKLDSVFTVCDDAAGEECPCWPRQPMSAHWGMPDPAAFEGSDTEKALAFADTMRGLTNRISVFVSLPLKTIDKLSLQRRLDEIGKSHPSAA